MITGKIFNIQKYSVHDGPGIRTTVFMKGCPLKCLWCHNPESQSKNTEVLFLERRCISCGACVNACTENALKFAEGKIVYIKEKCKSCGKCAGVCPTGARETAGKIVTADYVIKEVLKDRIFYDESKGGVTFSGGEPLMQPDFLYEMLLKCKEEDIHTALDTSGFASWEVLERIAPLVDLFLYDVKLIDEEKHKKYTNASNSIILSNLKKLSDMRAQIFARIPIIPGINDDEENIFKTGEFLSKLYIKQVNLLPYHNISMDKYNRLAVEYKLKDTPVPSDDEMKKISRAFESFGLNIKIGG